ncbi:ATP-binding protein [bacterium]|nr:ATP-binding protein [bacterium]
MRLTDIEYLNYSKLISSKMSDLNIFRFLKTDRDYFNKIGLDIETADLNFNHAHYLNIYDSYIAYIDTNLNSDIDKLKKLQAVLDECHKEDVSDSYITLLKSEFSKFETREQKNISLLLGQYNISRVNYDQNTYWKSADLVNKNVISKIKEIISPLNSIFVFGKIKHIFTNIVLVGANGSGKSRFSRQITRSKAPSSPISIIPAQHILGYEEFNAMANNNFLEIIQNYDAQEKIGSNDFYSIKDDFTNLIKFLQSDYNECARKEQKDRCVFNKVSNIFGELIKSRKVIFNNDSNMPVASTLDGQEYSINEMSDGEKAILYFIIHVVNAKANSFIVIDEPENHLHYDACISLWNRLEEERKDCTFLYLSHSIDFALSRNNATFIWNKSFIYPNEWDIEIINDNELPKKVYLEILGTVPPILYCEGESNSLDKQVYSAIFPDYLIKECGGCDVVKQYKISINRLGLEKNKSIYAVVDRDLKSDNEVKKCYSKYGINVLKVLEVENLLFVPELSSVIFGCDYNDFKKEYFDLCIINKESMINERLKDVLKHKLNNIKSKSFMNEYENKSDLRFTLANVRKERKIIETQFEDIIKRQDYMEALKSFDLKNSLFNLADRFVSNYKDKAINLLKSDKSMRQLISKKYIGLVI